MKKQFSTLAVLFILGSSISSFAADRVYECSRDDDGDDWSITVKEDGSLANFFDNDHDTAMANFRTVENRITRARIHSLKGNDGTTLSEFILNTRTLTGTLTERAGTPDAYPVAFSCTVEKENPKHSVDWKAAQKAIANADRNDGSTHYPAIN